MAQTTRLTSKGQMTIPSIFRKKLGLQPGDLVLFEERDGKMVIRKAEPVGRSNGEPAMHLKTRMTSKGQVTIPITIRKKLRLRPHDALIFESREDDVVVERAVDIMSLAGTVAYGGPPLDWRQLKEEFESAVVEDALRGVS